MRTSTFVKRAAASVALAALIGGCSSSDDTATNSSTATTTASESGGDTSTTESSTTESSTTEAPTAAADIAARPSPGCSKATTAAELTKVDLTVGDKARWWLVSAPATEANATPTPLVMDFHGLLEGASIHSQMSGLSAFAKEKNFVLAVPDGFGNPIHWEVGLDKATNYDLQFVDAMLENILASRCIDTARVYATGLSNGAFMSSTLACTHADVFAAVAPVAGVQAPEPCDTDRAVPVLAFHGTNDQILKYNGGTGGIPGFTEGATDPLATPAPEVDLNGEGYPANVKAWAKRNGCEDTPKDETTDTGEATTPQVIHRVYDCPAGADVEFYTIVGAGHTWPGSKFSAGLGKVMGPTALTIDANAIMWDFFSNHALAD